MTPGAPEQSWKQRRMTNEWGQTNANQGIAPSRAFTLWMNHASVSNNLPFIHLPSFACQRLPFLAGTPKQQTANPRQSTLMFAVRVCAV
jgi:hypothetical protein